jgi:MFS family permease
MWQSQALQTVVVAIIAVLAALGRAGILDLAVLAFLLGIGEVVFGNAAQTVLPELVPKPMLHKANGQQYAIQTAGQLFVGPPVGSLLFGVAVGLPFGIDAASFAISAALLATLPHARRERVAHPRLRTSIAEGLRYLTGSPLLRTLAILLGVNNFCGQFGMSTLVLYATQTLHVTTRGYGLLLIGMAIGAVLGGLVNAPIVARIGERAALVSALVGLAAVALATGLAPDAVALSAFLGVSGFLVTLWNIVTVSLRQELVPTELLGRVNSVYRMLGWGFMPLGAIAGGFIAHWLGLRAPYIVASGIRMAALLVAVPIVLAALRTVREPQDVVGRPA